ncbi:ATP-dependent helicase [Paenibacillus polymyxa]|uniref:ATP-dependent helicase n=1 Tax=Paenibacillus polymyxa TaxID=1406 RepID=UPI002AB3DF32|nr:ATP-dependent helicase [Paenibacillus polymyxa]MDY8021238.1 ATP-dependent helicase [Paenibacillus polymyxa]
MQFNDQQKQAIDFYKGACAVIAGAGSGKSTVLINRIKNLIENHGVPEQEILAITFTRNTADELKKKLSKMGYIDINIGTFHSICSRILAKEGINLTQDKLIKEWQIEKLFADGENRVDVKDIISYISYQKNYMRSYTDTFIVKESIYSEDELREYFRKYELFKQTNDLHDFDDYLLNCLEVLKNNPNKHIYDFVLVDEHQDSNLVQNYILKEICKSENMFCVFDYRQAIFSFRGGNPEYCMNFSGDWKDATIINLDTNYRSTSNIVNGSNNFIEKYYGNYEHYSQAIPCREEQGYIKIKTSFDRESEGEEIANDIEGLIHKHNNPKEIAVLYRLNSHSSYIEHELRKRNIEYDIVNDSSFFKRKEIAGILAYMKLIINPHDDGAFLEMFKLRNQPLAYFSEKVLSEIKRYSGVNNVSMYEALLSMRFQNNWQKNSVAQLESYINKLRLQNDKNIKTSVLINNIIKVFQMNEYIESKYSNDEEIKDRKDSLEILKTFVKSDSPIKFLEYISSSTKKKNKDKCVKLMSVHASKGLEFDNIFLIGVEDGKFPHYKSDLTDEARLFYVGVTRSKENLTISQLGTDNQFVNEYID